MTMLFDSADTSRPSRGKNPYDFIYRQLTTPNGAGYHGSRSPDREGPVDWKAKQVLRLARRPFSQFRAQHESQLVEPFAGAARAAHYGWIALPLGPEQRDNVASHQRDPFVIDEIALGECNNDSRDLEQVQDR